MPRVCKICSDPRRVEIEKALIRGENSKLSISRQFGVSKDSIYNHLKNHMFDRIARSGEIQAVEGLDLRSELNSVGFMLKNALLRANKTHDEKAIQENAKVYVKILEAFHRVELSFHQHSAQGIDPDELQEFRAWKAKRDQGIDSLLELPESIKIMIDKVCVAILALESGATIHNADRKYEPPLKVETAKAPSKEIREPLPDQHEYLEETSSTEATEPPHEEAEEPDMRVRPIPSTVIPGTEGKTPHFRLPKSW